MHTYSHVLKWVCKKIIEKYVQVIISVGIKLLEMQGEACWESDHYSTIFSLYKVS